MPVIVIAGDTPLGLAVIDAFRPETREVRAFVSSIDVAEDLKRRGVKVALGDVSDGSHVGGAALRAHTAVVLAEAATDERERSFAATPQAVVAAWAEGLAEAGVKRIIWVDDGNVGDAGAVLGDAGPTVVVSASARGVADVVADVVRFDEAAEV